MATTLRIAQEGTSDVPTFDACYQRHRHDVFRLCLRYGGGRKAWAEDVTHDVFVKLLEHLPTLEDASDLGGWLYRVTANLCISRLQRDQFFLTRLWRFGSDAEEVEPSAEVLFEEKESAAAAMASLRALPARERVALSMKIIDGKSQKEIATTLGMSEGYVSKLLSRAWSQVRAAGWEADDAQA